MPKRSRLTVSNPAATHIVQTPTPPPSPVPDPLFGLGELAFTPEHTISVPPDRRSVDTQADNPPPVPLKAKPPVRIIFRRYSHKLRIWRYKLHTFWPSGKVIELARYINENKLEKVSQGEHLVYFHHTKKAYVFFPVVLTSCPKKARSVCIELEKLLDLSGMGLRRGVEFIAHFDGGRINMFCNRVQDDGQVMASIDEDVDIGGLFKMIPVKAPRTMVMLRLIIGSGLSPAPA